MRKVGFWKSDWFFGLIVSIVILVLGNGELLQSLERKAYDIGVASTTRVASDKIAVIAIDKQSLDNIGRWPWSRDIMADMVEKLAAAKAKVIATTIFFSEPQLDPGLAYVNQMITACNVTLPTTTAAAPVAATAVPESPMAVLAPQAAPAVSPLCPQVESTLIEAEKKLNTDRRLAQAFASAGNVALPMLFVQM